MHGLAAEMPGNVQKTRFALEFVRTFCPTADKLRTRKPNIHAVVAVSAVVAVKNTKGRKKVCEWAGLGALIALHGWFGASVWHGMLGLAKAG